MTQKSPLTIVDSGKRSIFTPHKTSDSPRTLISPGWRICRHLGDGSVLMHPATGLISTHVHQLPPPIFTSSATQTRSAQQHHGSSGVQTTRPGHTTPHYGGGRDCVGAATGELRTAVGPLGQSCIRAAAELGQSRDSRDITKLVPAADMTGAGCWHRATLTLQPRSQGWHSTRWGVGEANNPRSQNNIRPMPSKQPSYGVNNAG